MYYTNGSIIMEVSTSTNQMIVFPFKGYQMTSNRRRPRARRWSGASDARWMDTFQVIVKKNCWRSGGKKDTNLLITKDDSENWIYPRAALGIFRWQGGRQGHFSRGNRKRRRKLWGHILQRQSAIERCALWWLCIHTRCCLWARIMYIKKS